MKRVISLILAAFFVSLAGCSALTPAQTSLTSSASEQFLIDRLGSVDGLVVGVENDAAAFGVDMTDFADDGYIIRSDGDDTLIFGKTEDGLDRAVRYYVNYCDKEGALNVSYGEGYRVKAITIAGRDISEYSIYLFEGADQCHTIAASELQKYIALACGVELAIVREPAEHMIVLERVGEDDSRSDVLYRDGFNISVKENGNLWISGGRDRGCLYGVYELLKIIGWRFMVNGDTIDHTITAADYYLYESGLVDIPAGFEEEQTPSFDYRQGRFSGYLSNNDLLLKYHENDFIRGSSTYNGYGYSRGACHGLAAVTNSGYIDHLFDEEELELLKNHLVQPCYTNDDYIDACIAYYTDYINRRIAGGSVIGHDLVEVDISMNDTDNFCLCDKCLEYIRLDGSQTGNMLYFSNAIAEDLTEKFPGLYLSVLVYANAINPPKVTKPHPQLNCSVCYYNLSCANHDLSGDYCIPATNPLSDNFVTNAHYAYCLEEWSKIATRITVWTYPGNWYFNNCCSSSISTLKDDMRYLYDMGIHGIYPCTIESGYWNSEDWLVPYLLDELQWNATMTDEEYDALVLDYLTVFYGEGAAPYLMEFLKWETTVERNECWTYQGYDTPGDRLDLAKVQSDFEYWTAMFDKAMALAETAEQELGILKFSMSLYNTYVIAAHTEKYLNGTEAERAEFARVFEYYKENGLALGFDLDGKVLSEDDYDIEQNMARHYQYSYFNREPDGTEWYNKIW